MITLSFAKNKTYYVVGLGKSNDAAVKALVKAGADVRVWDDNGERLAGFDDKMVCEPAKAPWSKIKAVVMAPGILPWHEIAVTAREKNVPVICDIDLFAQSGAKTKIIGISGTNGKSTTTALVHHILDYDGTSQMGGNIGTPVLSLKNTAAYTVLELSSYQLERSPDLRCDVGVLLNITPDHLNWHGEMDDYVAAKKRLIDGSTIRIIGVDDKYGKDIAAQYDDAVSVSVSGNDIPFDRNDYPRLRGQHNLQNMLAAYHACIAAGLDHDLIVERMKSFEGLAHRQYLVRVINGVPYINDSKATNAEAAKMALRSFRNIVWIAGGEPKDGGLSGVDGDLAEVKKAYLYGEAAIDFAKFLSVRGVPVETCETLDEAVNLAHKMAQDMRGEPTGAPTVLFSPACASFDQYKNFEERGNHFCDLVNGLQDV